MILDDDILALRAVCRAAHVTPRGSIQTRALCACGNGSGGPSGRPACRALRGLMQGHEIEQGDMDALKALCPDGSDAAAALERLTETGEDR